MVAGAAHGKPRRTRSTRDPQLGDGGSQPSLVAEYLCPSDGTARVGQRPMAPRTQCLQSTDTVRLIKAPLPLFPARSARDWRRTRRANHRAVLISAVNATACLPPNGYM